MILKVLTNVSLWQLKGQRISKTVLLMQLQNSINISEMISCNYFIHIHWMLRQKTASLSGSFLRDHQLLLLNLILKINYIVHLQLQWQFQLLKFIKYLSQKHLDKKKKECILVNKLLKLKYLILCHRMKKQNQF